MKRLEFDNRILKNEPKNWSFPFYEGNPCKNFGWFKKKMGKHEPKTYIFCGWVGGWYTLLRPHSGSLVSIYPNYARTAASLRSNKCKRPILGFHFFDGEFLVVSFCALFCVLTSDFCLFIVFCALFNYFIYLTIFLRFFLPFFAPFISHNLTNSNTFFRILNPI